MKKRSKTTKRSSTTTTAAASPGSKDAPTASEDRGEKGWWSSVTKAVGSWGSPRKFATLTVVLVIPRLIPVTYHYIHLRTELRGGLGFVPVENTKQLLIVGTMGSGTAQMNLELNNLGIEVGHENSDSVNEYCREGTVGHAHALRFFPGRPNLQLLCAEPRFNAYHSSMFKESDVCNYRLKYWDMCWERECKEVTAKEFGCARNDTEGGSCITPFKKSLLQVRHPLRVIASLVHKSGGPHDCSNSEHQLATAMALLPDGVVKRYLGLPSFSWKNVQTCVERWAWYWVLYNKAALPQVDGFYRVETTPPCAVAVVGGFFRAAGDGGVEVIDADDGVGGNKEHRMAQRLKGKDMCEKILASNGGPGRGEQHGYHNRKNVGDAFTVTWADLKGLSHVLYHEVATMALRLGYEDDDDAQSSEA